MIKAIADILTVLLGCTSAFCWWRSAVAKVPHAHCSNDGIFHDMSIAVGGVDFLATATLQAKWNRRAAIVASTAALSQVVGTVSPWLK